MLHEELRHDFYIVKLNAWHYRDDGQLLAALMTHIREEAIPPPLTFCLEHIMFRLRLLWQRKNRLVFLVIVLTTIWIAYVINGGGQTLWTSLQTNVPQPPLTTDPTMVKQVAAWLVGLVISGLALYRLSVSSFNAFSEFSPELINLSRQVAKAMQTGAVVQDWTKDAGLRYRFAQDFKEVSRALGNRRLILLIDDLDRCEPQQIGEVMATLNFLFASSAWCYVVLAMDWHYVTTALGVAFKDMALASDENDSQGKAFAEQYVEKIIQLRIDLPKVDSSKVTSDRNSYSSAKHSFRIFEILKILLNWLPILLLVLAVWPNWKTNKEEATFNPTNEATIPATNPTEREPSQKIPATSQSPSLAETVTQNFEIIDEPSIPVETVLIGILVMYFLGLFLMAWRLTRGNLDTRVFIEVMEHWKDWLAKHHETPRDWKRVMNRARLFAMRLQVDHRQRWFGLFWRKGGIQSYDEKLERKFLHWIMLDLYSKGEFYRAIEQLVEDDSPPLFY